MRPTEADEIDIESLEAAADMWDHLVKGDFYEIQERKRQEIKKASESLQTEERRRTVLLQRGCQTQPIR
jgi:hypothetical protein